MYSFPLTAAWMFAALLAVPETAESPAADPFQAALVESVHHFAEEGKLAHVRALLDKYPKLLDAHRGQQLGKPTIGDGYTPLQTAARHGREDIAEYLIKQGANVNAAEGYGYTPLHLAAQGGHLAVVRQLLKAGADVAAKTLALPGGTAPGPAPNQPPATFDPVPARTAKQIAEDQNHAEVANLLNGIK